MCNVAPNMADPTSITLSVNSLKQPVSVHQRQCLMWQLYGPRFHIFQLVFICFICVYWKINETKNFLPKFREIFQWRETAPSTHRMKTCKKLFFCQSYAIFWDKMIHAVIERYLSLFLKWFEDFSYRWQSL